MKADSGGSMTRVLMSLGDFQFEIARNAFQTLQRTRSYRLIETEVHAGSNVQHTGRGSDTITLDGVLYPVYLGEEGMKYISDFKKVSDKAEPLILLSVGGENFGRFLVEKIEESWESLTDTGVPEKVILKISLKEFQNYEAKRREKVKPEKRKKT